MPKARVREEIPASAAAVFALLHDYDHRLEWDTLLQAAYFTDGHAAAKLGAVAVRRGRASLGGIALKTRYISFRPGEVAAVKMINRPPFFDRFAATIQHRDLGNGCSSVEYHYNFAARPRWLRFLLHPLMNILFRLETKKRLRALRKHFRQGNVHQETILQADGRQDASELVRRIFDGPNRRGWDDPEFDIYEQYRRKP